MTDAKEPEVIRTLRQDVRDGNVFLHDKHNEIVCATAVILQAYDALRVERDALQVRNSEFWDAPAVSRVEWDALRAERDALNAEVQQSRLEFQVMQKHAQQDAAEIQRLRAERDALRKVYEAAEDFIGAQGTAYEADQYLMLCGVLKSYNAALEAQP
jgi:glucosamine 6-phosphate synthetase-like amidotransferase/phosphosugar isomerase protein